MSGSSLVSIVIPVYNEADGIARLREELSRLSTNSWSDTYEFVVVDDGSSDDTWEKPLFCIAG